jgi:hypothetical protein
VTTFGIDISHHQDLSLDLARCRREAGIEFVFIKCTEGATLVDPEFATNLAEARAAGQLVAAYHYVRSNASAQAQVDNVRRVVPRDVPVVPDVETGSGGVSLLRELVDRLRAAGYRVPLVYLPRWYWQSLGSPSLVGLPPLWSSRYPDNVINDLSVEWATVPASYWTGYGGLDVAVLQFTSSARVAGYAPLDANAFRGTRQRLAELLGYEKRRGSNVHNLILAREAGTPRVWVGDGMTRRHVADETELEGLLFWIAQRGGDVTVNEGWEDLRVLGAPVAADVAELKARPVGSVDVDEAALAVAIATELESNGVVGITPEQVETAVRSVFADAGSDDTE